MIDERRELMKMWKDMVKNIFFNLLEKKNFPHLKQTKKNEKSISKKDALIGFESQGN